MAEEKPINKLFAPQKEEGESKAEYEPAALGGRMDKLEAGQAQTNNSVQFVTDTNRFILVILFLGLVGFLASAIIGMIQTLNENTATQIEYIKSTEELKSKVDVLNSRLDEATRAAVLK